MRKPNLSNIKQAKVLAPAKDLATLEAELAEQEDHLEDTVLRLSDYLSAVEMVIKQTFDHRVWVKAEIRNLSSKGGHYYFELAEKDDDGKVVASCRGNLWRFLWRICSLREGSLGPLFGGLRDDGRFLDDITTVELIA